MRPGRTTLAWLLALAVSVLWVAAPAIAETEAGPEAVSQTEAFDEGAAEEDSGEGDGEKAAPEAGMSAEAQANNPLANFTAFNIQNYYIPQLSGLNDQEANTFWLRYAQPTGDWLVRASLPISRVPVAGGGTTSGLGDFNVFGTYMLDTGSPAKTLGVGPQLTFPTATEDETGTGKYQGGLAAVYFDATSPTLQWGGLITWQASFAGDDDRADTNMMALQPFAFAQAGNGVYFRSSGIMVYDLKTGNYHIPVGFGIGKVIKGKGRVYNVYIEPQYTILDRGPGQPEVQVLLGFNTQFMR